MHELKNIIEPIEPMRINLIPLTIVDSIRHCTFCLKKKKIEELFYYMEAIGQEHELTCVFL